MWLKSGCVFERICYVLMRKVLKGAGMDVIRVLIVDDEESIRRQTAKFLAKNNYETETAATPSEAFRILARTRIDIILLDIKLPEMDGTEVLRRVKEEYPDIEVIMMTGHGHSEVILKAMRLGAFDFFYKPIDLLEVKGSFERTNKFIALTNRLLRVEKHHDLLSKELTRTTGSIIGKSDRVKALITLTLKAAKAKDTSVLITGASGSGKELVARVLHFASGRKDGYFFPLNCSAIPETLIESEFFGHNKGAFTGAVEDKAGAFEAANGGTLFLDEISEMSLPAQAKLLRVLEERKVKRVGASKETPVDVRVVAATNKDLASMIEEKAFREDLFYRINTIEIPIPSLAERREDIPLLIDYYVDVYAKKLNRAITGVDEGAMERLSRYEFPGNVRELKNLVERAIILCEEDVLRDEHFPSLAHSGERNPLDDVVFGETLSLAAVDNLEARILLEALSRTKENKTKAAALLGISKYAFDRRMKKHGL